MKSVMFALAIACSLSLSVGRRDWFTAGAEGSLNGEEVFLNRCSTCHATERALVAPRTRKGWEGVLAEMVNNMARSWKPGSPKPFWRFSRSGMAS